MLAAGTDFRGRINPSEPSGSRFSDHGAAVSLLGDAGQCLLDDLAGERKPVTNRQQHHLDALILMDEHVEGTNRFR